MERVHHLCSMSVLDFDICVHMEIVDFGSKLMAKVSLKYQESFTGYNEYQPQM